MSKTTIPAGGLATDSVTTAKIVDDAVTAAKAAFSAGKIGQVLQDTTFSASSSTSSTDIEMFAIGGVTLASTSSKVLLIASCPNVYKSGGDCSIKIKLKYGSTQIAVMSMLATSSSADHYGGSTLSYLYSPNSTSPETFYVTYARDGSAGTAGIYVNGNAFTLMEILA